MIFGTIPCLGRGVREGEEASVNELREWTLSIQGMARGHSEGFAMPKGIADLK
jgi:hypothetical protein